MGIAGDDEANVAMLSLARCKHDMPDLVFEDDASLCLTWFDDELVLEGLAMISRQTTDIARTCNLMAKCQVSEPR